MHMLRHSPLGHQHTGTIRTVQRLGLHPKSLRHMGHGQHLGRVAKGQQLAIFEQGHVITKAGSGVGNATKVRAQNLMFRPT